jgi:hypothetical protein
MGGDDHGLTHRNVVEPFFDERRIQPACREEQSQQLDVLRPARLTFRGSHVVRFEAESPLYPRHGNKPILPTFRELLESKWPDDVCIVTLADVESLLLPESLMKQPTRLLRPRLEKKICIKGFGDWTSMIIPQFGVSGEQ